MNYFDRQNLKSLTKSNRWNSIDGDRLVKAFLSAKTPDMLRLFLDELLTDHELETCIRRLQAANMLFLAAPYSIIKISTGLSSKIIARISKQLRDKKGGYREILRRVYPQGQHYFD